MPRLKINVAENAMWTARIEKEIYAKMMWPKRYGHLAKNSTKHDVMSRDVYRVPNMEELEARLKEVTASLAKTREDIDIYELTRKPQTVVPSKTKKV